MIPSCSPSAVRSQRSTNIRIWRATRYEPPVNHAGSPWLGATQTSSSMSVASDGGGFAVPSLKPSRFRRVAGMFPVSPGSVAAAVEPSTPPGRCWKPWTIQRTTSEPRVPSIR